MVVVDEALASLRLISTIVAHVPDVVVHPFTSADQALVWARHNTVDAFVLDCSPPAATALETVAILRAEARFALLPLIVVSAESGRDVRVAALAAGANGFIERSVEPHEFIARLQTLLVVPDAHAKEMLQAGRLESSLLYEERRVRQQAERLAALWRIANNSDLSEDELMQEVLDQSTGALRSGQFFTSSLSRLDGGAVVVESRSFDPEVYEATQTAPIGTRLALADSIQKVALQSGKTRTWDDIATDPVASQIARVRTAGCRALIVTPFTVNRQTFFLTFWSREPVRDPFGADDITYVELIARFFAVRLQESRQSHRVDYHISHDALTGLRNRTQFRLDARLGYQGAKSGAVAVVDLAGFRDVNESYGHIIGDALLAEVGAALERRATATPHDEAIVARLAGDTFGIFWPGIASPASRLGCGGALHGGAQNSVLDARARGRRDDRARGAIRGRLVGRPEG